MGFDSRGNARTYTPQDGDSLRAIAERETSAGNQVTWQDIAKFNWGTDDPDEVNEYMRDELGCYRRDDANNFVISSDDDRRSDLLIPVQFERTGMALNRTHTLRVQRNTSPSQFFECASIPGVTFEFDKSFVRPTVVDHIGALEEAIGRHPEAKIMIFGHTDTAGDDPYNKSLSERRARSVYAFITDDPDTWESLYNQEQWGLSAVQQIMTDFGGPYDPGRTDGVQDDRTTQAIRQYQTDNGLSVDGVAGPNTRRAMFREYMTSKHDVQLTPDKFMDPKHIGCGEFNPIDAVEGAHEPNRRVTFYLFNPDRLPRLPCRRGDLSPCRKQMTQPAPRHHATFRCSFYDSLARDCACEVGPVTPVEMLIRILECNDHFAPSTEQLDIRYEIRGLSGRTVRIEITSEHYPNNPIYQRELTDAEKADGEHPINWDGRANCTGGDLQNKYINPLYDPYMVRIYHNDQYHDEQEFKVLYHSIVLDWGKHYPETNPPPDSERDRYAQNRLNELGYDAGPVDGNAGNNITTRALRRFQRTNYRTGTQTLLTENGNLDADTFVAIQGAAQREIWEAGKIPLTQDCKFYVYDNFYNDRGENFVTTNLPQFSSQNRKQHAEDRMERAYIALEVEIKLLNKSNNAVSAPDAVGPAPVAWEVDDATEDVSVIPNATNATGRTYVERARQFGRTANVTGAARIDQNGDNAHKDFDGFRESTDAANIQSWFPNNAQSRLSPYSIDRYAVENRGGTDHHRALVKAWDHQSDYPDRKGHAGVYFRHSTKGGDDAKIRSSICFDGLPNRDRLIELHRPYEANLVKETGRWTVLRRMRVSAYCQQKAPTRNPANPDWGWISARWGEAFNHVENNGAPLQRINYSTVVTEDVYKNTILALPVTHRPPGVNSAADLNYHTEGIYGGPAIARNPHETPRDYCNRVRTAMIAWIRHPLNAILGVIHDEVRKTSPEGLMIFDYSITHQAINAGPDAAPPYNNFWPSNSGYVRLDGAVTMNVDNSFNVSCYVLHECGHAKFLYHHHTRGGTGAGDTSDNPTHHDADQERCTMSYAISPDGPAQWFYPFCGKCILRLRGWNVIILPNQYTT